MLLFFTKLVSRQASFLEIILLEDGHKISMIATSDEALLGSHKRECDDEVY